MMRPRFASRPARVIRVVTALTAIVLASCVQVATAQDLNLIPRFVRQGYDANYPTAQTFLDACLNMDQWSYIRSVTRYLGYWDNLSDTDNATLMSCFQGMNAAGLQLSIETGGAESWCGTGDACFDAYVGPRLTALLNLGAPLGLVRLQEPMTKALDVGWDLDIAMDETINLIRRIHDTFPGVRISWIEAHPYIHASTLQFWIGLIDDRSRNIGTAPPDYIEIDHDWVRPYGEWTWDGLRGIRDTAHARGWGFAVIFWTSDTPDSTNSYDWYRGTLTQGSYYQSQGIVPDLYTIESWLNWIPWSTVPEGDITTFMGTAAQFRAQGYFPR